MHFFPLPRTGRGREQNRDHFLAPPLLPVLFVHHAQLTNSNSNANASPSAIVFALREQPPLSLSPFSLFFSPSSRSRWTPGLVDYLLVFQKFSREYFDNDRRYHINRTDSNGTSVCTCLFRLSIRDLESLLLLCIIETSIIIPFYPRFITELIIIFRSNESRIRLISTLDNPGEDT